MIATHNSLDASRAASARDGGRLLATVNRPHPAGLGVHDGNAELVSEVARLATLVLHPKRRKKRAKKAAGDAAPPRDDEPRDSRGAGLLARVAYMDASMLSLKLRRSSE